MRWILALTALALAAGAGSASAATLSFTGTFSSDWNTAANWTDASDSSLHAVPTAVDDAQVPFGTAPVLSAGDDGAARSLVLEPGASLSVSGRALAIAGGAPSTFQGAVTLIDATLRLGGASTWSGGDWSFDGSTASNTGDLTITGDVTAARVNAASTFTNTGSITRDDATPATGAAVFTTRVDNAGTFSVAHGTADLRGGGAHTGPLSVAAGAVLAASGAHALGVGGAIQGAGTLKLDAGTLKVPNDALGFAPGTLVFSGGFLDLAQDSEVGRLTSDGEGGGRASVAGAPTGLLIAGGPTLLDNVTLGFSGTRLTGPSVTMRKVTLSAAVLQLTDTTQTLWDSGGWTLTGESRIENAGALRITGDTTVVCQGASTVNSSGTITRDDATPGGVASIASILNDGDVDVVSGELALTGIAADTSGGTFTIGAGTVMSVNGSPALADKGEITGAGTLRLDGGTVKVPPGTGVFDPATVLVSGGFLDLGRNATVGRLTSDGQGGGRVNGGGTLNAGGPTVLDNVRLFDGATNLTGPDVTLRNLSVTSASMSVAAAAHAVWDTGDLQMSEATVTNNGELRVTGDGTAVNVGDPTLIQNNGTLIRDDTDPSTAGEPFTAPLRNSGVLHVVDGTLALGAAEQSAGGLTTVDSGAVLGAADGHYTVSGGRVQGSGTVAGVLENAAGTVGPGASPGRLSVDGDYIQGLDGTLEAEVAGTSAGTGYDQLAVSGAASLAGKLDVLTRDPFVPPTGSVYDVLVAGSLSGAFEPVNGTELADRTYDVEQAAGAPGRVRLSIAGEPPVPPAGGTPSIPGEAQSGDTVTCDTGAWTGEPTSFDITWLRNGAPIAGATSADYTLTADDEGQTIQCQVVANNAGGPSDPALSNELVPTAPATPAPTNTALPTIPASARTGDALTCAPGSWTGSPTFAFAWLRDGVAIASGASYTVVAGDVGHALRCRVTASNAGGDTVALSSAITPTAPPPPAPVNQSAPTIPGAAQTGDLLVCATGTWTGSPTFAFAWLRDGVAIASGSSYTVVAADVGHALRCRVTASNAGGDTVALSSAVTPTAPPPPPPAAPTNTVLPSIPAAARTGDALTCAPGSWTGSPTFAFAWLRDGTAIASGASYTVVAADVGHALRCRVTASNAGGDTVALSAATTPTAPPPAAPENTALPTIPGTAQTGDALTCAPGSWTGSPTFAFAWLRDGVAIASGASYTVVAADVGHALRCRVTASNAGGDTTALSSAVTPTAPPPPPPPPPPPTSAPVNVSLPVVAGVPAKQRSLQCQPGTWTGDPVFAYQWLLDGRALSGQTEPEYRVRGRDVGHVISCRVTARNAGGTTTATSKAVPAAKDPEEFGLPSGERCVAASTLKLRLRAPAGTRIKSVGLYVDGHRRLALQGKALPAVVWVRRLPRKQFVLGVRALERNGSWQHAAQRYLRCRS